MRPVGNDVTGKGHTCRSKCGATADEGASACDWCWTNTSWLSWDYCVYPPMQAFDAQPWKLKTQQIWDQITDPKHVHKSAPDTSVFTTGMQALSESMITTFDDQFEVLPKGRSKVIHAQGAVCKITLDVSADSAYTGILKPGNQSGFLRLGSAVSLNLNPVEKKVAATLGLPPPFPGYGIKFLRSGRRSANWVGLRQAGPGKSYNFFDGPLSNHVNPPDNAVLTAKFQQTSGCINMVGLSDACAYEQDGSAVNKEALNFPFELLFEPTVDVANMFPGTKKSNTKFLTELESIPAGTPLFKVVAFASPADAKAGKSEEIGVISTASNCYRSTWGDAMLFMRHQRMEEDFAAKPEWIAQVDDPKCKASAGPVSKWQCAAPPMPPPELSTGLDLAFA